VSGLVPRKRNDVEVAKAVDDRLYKHSLEAWERGQKDQIDSMVFKDAVQFAYDEECTFVDHGLAKANGSQTKQKLLADKLDLLSTGNNRRIVRRFMQP